MKYSMLVLSLLMLLVFPFKEVSAQNWVPCYRLVKVANNHQEHFYTISEAEKQQAISDGYTLEVAPSRSDGIAFYLSNTTFVGGKEVFRLKKVGDGFIVRLYTTNPVEKEAAISAGYVFETIAGYVSATHMSGLSEVYRTYRSNIGDRFYTTDHSEFLATLNGGYVQETTLGYVSMQASQIGGQMTIQQLVIDVEPNPIEIQDLATLRVEAHYSDGSIVDVTSDGQLQFSNPHSEILERPTDTTLKALQAGSATISATLDGITQTYQVDVVDTVGPNIIVSSHMNEQQVDDEKITLIGTTSDPSGVDSVTVNGMNPQGKMSFRKALTLQNGANVITIVAKDDIGNTNTVSLTLYYEMESENPEEPESKMGFQGVYYHIKNPFDVDPVAADTLMYIFSKFMASEPVHHAMKQASWHKLHDVNLDLDNDELWHVDMVSGKETGIAFLKKEIILFEDETVRMIQRYQKIQSYHPSDSQLDGKELLQSIRVIMQKQPFLFLDEGEIDGLITVEVFNNRYVQIHSTGVNLAKREDASVVANGLMRTERFVESNEYSFYFIEREMIDLLHLESKEVWGDSATVLRKNENSEYETRSTSSYLLHMVSSVFMQMGNVSQGGYAGFLALPGLDFESVKSYLFSMDTQDQSELHSNESSLGYFQENIERLKEIDEGFFDMMNLKTLVSGKTRKNKYLWAFKAISGLDSNVTDLFEDAQFFISASEIVDLIMEGKYATAFVELAAEFAGEMVASTVVASGVSGLCSGSALTGPGAIAICGGALAASPALYVSIGNTTYNFVKEAGLQSFAMFFDGLAYLFDREKAQKLSEFIGYDWLLYQEQSRFSQQGSFSKNNDMKVIDATHMDMISSYDSGSSNVALISCEQGNLCMDMHLSDSFELQVIELAIFDIHKDVITDETLHVDFIHESGEHQRVVLSLSDIHSVITFDGEMHMSQFLLRDAVYLRKGGYKVKISCSLSGEYQVCWMTKGENRYHRFFGRKGEKEDSSLFGCQMSLHVHDVFTPYVFLFLISLLILSRVGQRKMRIRF